MDVYMEELGEIVEQILSEQEELLMESKATEQIKAKFKEFIAKLRAIKDPQTIINVLQTVVKSKSTEEAQRAMQQVQPQQPTQQLAQPQQPVQSESMIQEGIWDRMRAAGSATKNAANALGGNVAKGVKNIFATAQNKQSYTSVLGAMQTGKFETLLQQYIKKIQNLQNEVGKYLISVKDPQEQKDAQELNQKLVNFVQGASAALRQTASDLKNSGYHRGSINQEQQAQTISRLFSGFSNNSSANQSQQPSQTQAQQPSQPAQQPSQPTQQPYVPMSKSGKPLRGKAKALAIAKWQREHGQANESYSLFDMVYESIIKSEEGPIECDDLDELFEGWFGDKLNLAKKAIKQKAKETGKAAVQLGKEGLNAALGRGPKGLDKIKDNLARIVGELNMDLKDCGWNQAANPELANVIRELEQTAQGIHGQDEHGKTTQWDRFRHGVGNIVQSGITSVATAAAVNALTPGLQAFIGPRGHAALVAGCTVLLRGVMKNVNQIDVDKDKREKTFTKGLITSSLVAAALIAAARAYITNRGEVQNETPVQTQQIDLNNPTLPPGNDKNLSFASFVWEEKGGLGNEILNPSQRDLTEFMSQFDVSPDEMKAFLNSGKIQAVLGKLLGSVNDVSSASTGFSYKGNPMIEVLSQGNEKLLHQFYIEAMQNQDPSVAAQRFLEIMQNQTPMNPRSFMANTISTAISNLSGTK